MSSNPGDDHQRVAITGFNAGVTEIRIWTGDLRPLQVTIESSTTSKTSIDPAAYETTLVPLTSLGSLWTANGGLFYADFTVSAPVGTQSLYFDFGRGQDHDTGPGFARISELQAFSPVPEPASIVPLGLGAVGLVAVARRRRAAQSAQQSKPPKPPSNARAAFCCAEFRGKFVWPAIGSDE